MTLAAAKSKPISLGQGDDDDLRVTWSIPKIIIIIQASGIDKVHWIAIHINIVIVALRIVSE